MRILWLSMAAAGVLGALLGFSDGYVLILFALVGAIGDAMPVPEKPADQTVER